MAFKMDCPHCKKTLNVTEKALGRTVSCPGCSQPVTVPQQPESLLPPRPVEVQTPPVRVAKAQARATSPLPPGTPPMPQTGGQFEFLNESVDRGARRETPASFVQAINLGDMFLGKEKEHVFPLLPNEELLDELTIHHQHLFIVQRGITRVTLTTHRVLYTATRVFSPVYWVLVVLFPPLIFYYALRISRNRNVSMPLGGIDSVEKRYRPNWLLFIVAIFAGFILAQLCAFGFVSVFDGPDEFLGIVVLGGVLALVAAAVLVLLLATRIVGMEVRSCNNQFFVRFASTDLGVSEPRFDEFVQSLYAEIHRVRSFGEEAKSRAT